MQSATQIIFIINSCVIAISLIVGVILGSIALFKIANALKRRNKILYQNTRPYLVCQRSNQQLAIKNVGQAAVIIDEILPADLISPWKPQRILAGQVLYFNLSKAQQLNLTIKYHDTIDNYQENFFL